MQNKKYFLAVYLIFSIAKCFSENCTNENTFKNFLESNISGYKAYLSVEEFSELKTLQESYFYLLKGGETKLAENILNLGKEKYIYLKNSADEKFSIQIEQAEKRLKIIQENFSNNDTSKIQNEFLKLKLHFSETKIIPLQNSVFLKIDCLYNSAMIEKLQKKYVVKKNDCLVKISEQRFGTYKKWKSIYELNKNKMPCPENPNLIYPDMILVLP
ncbi:hypothetical protein [uncultured Treponema sp.]|uniref:LysM peptidoglycan-binding domain-containing protein n=1 Tax=uncultured Treponema sp. TaxID=162155 RepID=UPI000E861B15|nr:hypothetical protein [uncultured Treponema sp.]HAZ96174.1 hypothetical protein [Treponema sp.]